MKAKSDPLSNFQQELSSQMQQFVTRDELSLVIASLVTHYEQRIQTLETTIVNLVENIKAKENLYQGKVRGMWNES